VGSPPGIDEGSAMTIALILMDSILSGLLSQKYLVVCIDISDVHATREKHPVPSA
jgi:hypothetical protein